MNRYFIIILLALLVSCNGKNTVQAKKKTNVLSGSISNLPNKYVVLTAWLGFEPEIIDTLNIDKNGVFTFTFDSTRHTGMYRLMLGMDMKAQFYGGTERYLDIIYNYEDIELKADFNKIPEEVIFSKSKENKVFYDFYIRDNKVNTQLEILTQLKPYFPENDDFYPSIRNQYNKLQDQHLGYVKDLLKNNSNSFVANIISSMVMPNLAFLLDGAERDKYVKQHYFDNVNYNDTSLLYTNVLSTKSFSYLQLFRNQNMPRGLQEQAFTKAIDTIFKKAQVNEKVYKMVRNYIIKGFERIDNESILTYIAEKYTLNNTCSDDKEAVKLNRRVEGFKKLMIGTKVPNIVSIDANGLNYNLYDSKDEYTLIVFYASWCPHCADVLPKINTYLSSKKINTLTIVAISLDNEEKAWKDFIILNGKNWTNICDTKAWDGKSAIDFYIYATPTMFLLDKNKIILSKPIEYEEVIHEFKKAGL